jgi:hypothetical protein
MHVCVYVLIRKILAYVCSGCVRMYVSVYVCVVDVYVCMCLCMYV